MSPGQQDVAILCSCGTSPQGADAPATLCGTSSQGACAPATLCGTSSQGSCAPATLCRREQDRDGGERHASEARDVARYTGHNVRPTQYLRYDWTGWPTAGTLLPSGLIEIARATSGAWDGDGLRLIEPHVTSSHVQLLFSVAPHVSPVFFCQRVKGRLQHALRQGGMPAAFSRKVSFRSVGENTSSMVEHYIAGQVGKADFADARFRETMRQFTVLPVGTDLAVPSESNSGRYWYNLHVVLVASGRFRTTNPAMLGRLRDAALAAAAGGAHRIGALSVMPDHVHIALRGCIEQSPEQIALAFQNELARAAGCRAWQDGYYVGTFSEYDMSLIRRVVAHAEGDVA